MSEIKTTIEQAEELLVKVHDDFQDSKEVKILRALVEELKVSRSYGALMDGVAETHIYHIKELEQDKSIPVSELETFIEDSRKGVELINRFKTDSARIEAYNTGAMTVINMLELMIKDETDE